MISNSFEVRDPLEEYNFSAEVVDAFTSYNLDEAYTIREPHRTSAFWYGAVVPRIMGTCVRFEGASMRIHRQTRLATGYTEATVILRDSDTTILRNYALHDSSMSPRPLNQTTAFHDDLIRNALASGLEFDLQSAQEYGLQAAKAQASLQHMVRSVHSVPVA